MENKINKKNLFIILIVIIITSVFFIASCDTENETNIDTEGGNETDSDNQNNGTDTDTDTETDDENGVITEYKVNILRQFPHKGDRKFTQGFEIYKDYLYEGTGRTNQTSLKKIDIKTGDIIKQQNLEKYFPDNMYFGEGITFWNNEIIHLSWKREKAFVYTKDFEKTDKSYSYDTEGWGLTHNDEYLIMSDGSTYLYFRDPTSFEIVRKLDVGVSDINELEYVDGIIYANVWMKTFILMIDEESGDIVGKIDASNLLCSQLSNQDANAVLNGIAYDKNTQSFYLTGKECPVIYEAKFEKK